MRTTKPMSDTPKLDRDDSVNIQVGTHPFSFKGGRDKALYEQVVEAINRMGGVGPDAETNYQVALDALKLQSEKVVSIITKEYNRLPRQQYLDRWSLVQVLAELKDSSSLVALDDIISEPISSEKLGASHNFTTVGEEVMIRTTAVEAVTRLAANGNRQASELLLKHVRHENFSVKRACIQGYLAGVGDGARETLLKALPKDDHFILDIQRRDVRQVHQAQGGLFLINPDKDDLPPPQLSQPLNIDQGVTGDSSDARRNHDKP